MFVPSALTVKGAWVMLAGPPSYIFLLLSPSSGGGLSGLTGSVASLLPNSTALTASGPNAFTPVGGAFRCVFFYLFFPRLPLLES